MRRMIAGVAVLLVLACDADDGPSEREQCEQALGCVASCYALAKDDEFAPSAEQCEAQCGFYEEFGDVGGHSASFSRAGARPLFRHLNGSGTPYDGDFALQSMALDVEGMMSAWETCALIGEP